MSTRTLSGAAVSALALVALVVGVLVATSSASQGTSVAESLAAIATATAEPTTTPVATPAPVPAPLAPRSQDEAPEPSTDVPVLPQRCLDDGDVLPSRPGPCTIASYGKDRPTVVIWGDSHAWQQVPALKAQAQRTRSNLVAFMMGACPPMDLRGLGYRGLCVQQNEKALSYITAKVERQEPVKVVLGGFWELYRSYHEQSLAGWVPEDPHDQFLVTRAEMFDAGGARLFQTLGQRRVATAAIGQAPWVSAEAAPCEAGETPYACDLPRSIAIPEEDETATWVRRQLAQIRVAGYIDISRFVCGPDTCRATLRGEPVFLDSLHLDPAITDSFASEYRDLFS